MSHQKLFSILLTNRQARTQVDSNNSLVGTVDKAVLLEVVEQISAEYPSTEAEFAEQLRLLAGEEDIKTWVCMIAHQMQRSGSKPVSLLQLQQALGLPMIEIWLGLLLGEQGQYQWKTDGEFYHDVQNIWLIVS